MDNLITKTDFIGLIALVGTSQDWIETDLDAYITLYQAEYLKQFLGEHLYNLLDDTYDPLVTTDKWYKLVNGETYTKTYNGNDYTLKYKGVKTMLAYLIYYNFKSGIATQVTDGGEVVSNYENSKRVSIDKKAIKAYNLGVDLLGETIDYGDQDYVICGDLPFFLSNTSVDVLKANLFNYITYKNGEDATTYPNWIFKGLNKKNEFGI